MTAQSRPCRSRVIPGRPAPRCRGSRAVARLILVLAFIAVAAMVLPAGDPDQESALAAASSPLTAAPAVSRSPSAAGQVIAAYRAFFPALTAAEPMSRARAVALLAGHAAEPYLGHVLAQIAWYRAHGEVSGGFLAPHVTGVQVTGGQAIVRDCQDASKAWLVSTVTGEVIPGSTGSRRTYLIAVLARGSDRRWRLTLLARLAEPCSPAPSPS